MMTIRKGKWQKKTLRPLSGFLLSLSLCNLQVFLPTPLSMWYLNPVVSACLFSSQIYSSAPTGSIGSLWLGSDCRDGFFLWKAILATDFWKRWSKQKDLWAWVPCDKSIHLVAQVKYSVRILCFNHYKSWYLELKQSSYSIQIAN